LLGSYGLKTYIWNNRLKSIVLLAGFPFLLLLICFAFALVVTSFSDPDIGQGIADAVNLVPTLIPIAIGGAVIWFVIAWFANQRIVSAITRSQPVSRMLEPRVWNLLENLCISRGITMPKVRIIETEARNAFASGIRPGQYTITVTRGLMDALDDRELEAVLGHELTHIENRDVQLLVVSAVFVGIITLVGDLLLRAPRAAYWSTRSSRIRTSGGRGGRGGGAIVLILIAVVIFILARFLALALRFAMSRKREYLADAGAVELTKDPDAMIGALRKIAGHSEIEAPAQIQEMFLDHPRGKGFAGLFATHPPIEDRIDALVRYAGGREAIAAPSRATTDPRPTDMPQFGRRTDPPGTSAGRAPTPPFPGPWGTPRS